MSASTDRTQPTDRHRAIEALLLEHWLRFCFLVEFDTPDGTGLKLDVPEQRRAEAARLRPQLLPLLDRLDGREPDAEASCAAVTACLERLLGAQVAAEVTADPAFQRRAAEVQEAVRQQADDLDEDITFAAWLDLFGAVGSESDARS